MTLEWYFSLNGYSNIYLVGNTHTKEALIIDPAEMNLDLLEGIESHGWRLTAILATHNHIHHIRGATTLMSIYAPEIFASSKKIRGFECTTIRGNEEFSASGFSIKAFSVPGHSNDSLVFLIENCLFTGDTFSAGVLGSTRSRHHTFTLVTNVKNLIGNFPDSTIVLPSHGPPTSIGTELRSNLGLDEGYAEAYSSPSESLFS